MTLTRPSTSRTCREQRTRRGEGGGQVGGRCEQPEEWGGKEVGSWEEVGSGVGVACRSGVRRRRAYRV